MDESKTDAEVQTTGTAKDNETGNNTQELTVIERTNIAVERMEKATQERAALLDREEQFYANKKLGGRTEGAAQEKPKLEQTPKEYTEEVLAGKHNDN